MKTFKGNISRIFITLVIGVLAYGCAGPPPLPDMVWPAPPDPPRVKYVTQYKTTEDLTGRNVALDIVAGQGAVQALKKPNGVYVDVSGRIYVTDTARGDVMMLDTVNKEGSILGGRLLAKPIGVAVDKQGRIFVADSDTKNVAVFDKNGKLLATNIKPDEPFKRPSGIAIDNERDLLYVTDTYDHHVRVFDVNTLKQKRVIGGRGKEEGYFNFPSYLAVGPKGNLVVSDTQNGRVQIFDTDGKFLLRFGEFGDAPGMFGRPKGVAVDSEGHIYVVDAAFNNVQIFNDEGRILMAFSGYGTGRGEIVLPAGIAIDKDDYIYVVDSWGRRVEVFEFLGDKHKQREEAAKAEAEKKK